MTDPSIPEALAKVEEGIAETTKRGFDLSARLKNRGLRKGSITLFLDEELGAELGDAYDILDGLGNFVRREREGVIGLIEALTEDAEKAKKDLDALREQEGADADAIADAEKRLADVEASLREVEAERARLVAELTRTGITVKVRAVPPVIVKDLKRRAKESIGWSEKGLPPSGSEEAEAYQDAHMRHLLAALVQEVVDNETGAVNPGLDYEAAGDLIDHLPPSQFARLDVLLGQVQYADAISRQIESQEDFS